MIGVLPKLIDDLLHVVALGFDGDAVADHELDQHADNALAHRVGPPKVLADLLRALDFPRKPPSGSHSGPS